MHLEPILFIYLFYLFIRFSHQNHIHVKASKSIQANEKQEPQALTLTWPQSLAISPIHIKTRQRNFKISIKYSKSNKSNKNRN